MADPPLAKFHFLPWVRRGIALALQAKDDPAAPADLRPGLDANLQVVASKAGKDVDTKPIAMHVNLFGPADVRGIDPRHIIRTEPRDRTANFEPNYLAGIEFDDPDLPWLMTPAAPNVDRLSPWLCLIVLKAPEFKDSADPPSPLAKITVTNLAALPDLADSWAWAHTQITGDLPAEGIAGILDAAPGNVISRMICPRQLEADTLYYAFLVPAYEGGRLAGLGMDTATVAKATPAWPPAEGGNTLDLPVYFRFEFHTSDNGDFESLVRQLTPRSLPPEVGIRAMDVSKPAPPPFPGAGTTLGLEGALRSVETRASDWSNPGKSNFQNALEPLINLTGSYIDDPDHPNPEDPKVVPPIYGRWAAAVESVTHRNDGWINTLNLDPRNRATAGMGTQVVDGERNALLASAWQQVEGIERANQLLRQAQMARATMIATNQKHLLPADDAVFLSVTQTVHSKMLAGAQTVRAKIVSSRLPPRVFSGPFRRISRPQGPLRRRQGASGTTSAALADRINRGEVQLTPPPRDPAGMQSVDQVTYQLLPSWIPTWLRPFMPYLIWIPVAIFLLELCIILLLDKGIVTFPKFSLPKTSPVPGLIIMILILINGLSLGALGNNRFTQITNIPKVRFQKMTEAAVGSAQKSPNFTIVAPGSPFPALSIGGVDSPVGARFRSASKRFAAALQAPPPDPPPAKPADLSGLRKVGQERLDPVKTVPARVLAQIQLDSKFQWQPADPIAPIMAYPIFDLPMYEPLRDISQDYLLPGIEKIPADTMALVETNQEFIEAYMVGLNHEMARQLLWVNYPTDLRGSPFRQFWDVRSYVPQPADPADPQQLAENLRDIKPIHEWPSANPLGQNRNQTNLKPENLVLLLRGELLRRYPNAIIYACQAQWDREDLALSAIELHPLFRGTLDPDITFFGFDLTAQEARGGDLQQHGEPGWFLVFKQHPSEHRFGLEPAASDPVSAWSKLAWSDFPLQPPTPNCPLFLSPKVAPSPQKVRISAGSSDSKNVWGANSAQTAFILYRRPARIAVHASMMLPPLKGGQ